MTYDEAVAYIHATPKLGTRLGVYRIVELLRLLGDPQKQLKFIHVAGTNGKGSTVMAAASVMQAHGYKTGIFISPFVEDFRERIQINGEMISKEVLTAQVEKVIPLINDMRSRNFDITQFEIDTAIALDYFAREKCDIVCFEVGLGGRYDATNAIDAPDVAAICSISFDHTELLGDTLAKIAGEKCGIIKKGSRVAVYPNEPKEALEVILQTCREQDIIANVGDLSQLEILSCDGEGSRIRYRGEEYDIGLLGKHQIYNMLTVLSICEELRKNGWPLEQEKIRRGLAKASFGGRMERVCKSPLCVIDGAHNPDGIDNLCANIDHFYEGRNLIVVMGMLADKSYEYGISQVAKRAAKMITVTPDTPRGLPAQDAALIAARHCADVRAVDSPKMAAQMAKKMAQPGDVVLACGSLYMIGDAKRGFLE